MYQLTTTLLLTLVIPLNAFAQDKSPDEVYAERIETARAEYRVAIAKQIRGAKIVEIALLRFDDVRKVDLLNDDEQRFPIAPYEATTSVISQRKLTAVEMKPLLFELAKQIERPKHTGGALCHFPIHGVRVYSDEPSGEPFDSKILYSGTFCWACGNFGFEYPDGAEWIETNGKLKDIFNQLLPVPKGEVERFNKTYPSKPKTGEPSDARKTSAQSVLKSKSTPRSP